MEKDQRITKELGRYQLAPLSADLRDRVLLSAREAWSSREVELHWTERWRRACRAYQQEILAFASVLLLILGVVTQLGGNQSVLADSIERLTVIATVSGNLHRAASMDCTVLMPDAGDESAKYRVRWNSAGVTRVDINAIGGAEQTLWISKGTVSMADSEGGEIRSVTTATMPSKWQPFMEFLTPTILAQHMEKYGLTQAKGQNAMEPDGLLLVGQENEQAIEMSIDAKTGLPITLRKYLSASSQTSEKRDCLEEVQFQWNKPIAQELFVPGLPAMKQHAD